MKTLQPPNFGARVFFPPSSRNAQLQVIMDGYRGGVGRMHADAIVIATAHPP